MARLFDYDATWTSLLTPCRPPFFAGWQPKSDDALCMEIARVSYCAGQTVRDALAAVSYELVGEFGAPGTGGAYGIVVRGAQAAILSFRGSQLDDPTDIFDDTRFLPVAWPGQGLVHAGFADLLQPVWPDIQNLLATVDRPLIATGHSLGAALATLAASLLQPKLLITFGSPRVGDAAFCEGLARGVEGRRYVNCCDIVCQLPPPLPYQHFGQLRYIDRNGDLHVEPPEWRMAGDQLAGRADYVREHVWRPGNVGSRGLADHAPINYVSALAAAS